MSRRSRPSQLQRDVMESDKPPVHRLGQLILVVVLAALAFEFTLTMVLPGLFCPPAVYLGSG